MENRKMFLLIVFVGMASSSIIVDASQAERMRKELGLSPEQWRQQGSMPTSDQMQEMERARKGESQEEYTAKEIEANSEEARIALGLSPEQWRRQASMPTDRQMRQLERSRKRRNSRS